MVQKSVAEGRPYAMAFIDFRMPPGWDGMETTKHLWQVCPDLQIVICTAFADCPWEEVLEELNVQDRLLILKKPFDSIEVLQLARALTEKWRLREESKTRVSDLEELVKARTRALEESRTTALNMRDAAVQSRAKAELTLEELSHEMEERKKVEAQLLQAQKMDAIGRLAGGIAHDFNNILGAIMGNTEIAKLDDMVSPTTADCLDSILKATGRAADLVRQILSFSRRSEQERRPVQLHIVVAEAIKLLRATVPTSIEFKTSLAKPRTVLVDSSQIHQVVMNLCTNAAHAMRDRPGILTVELDEMELDTSFTRVHPDLRPGPYARLKVADNGCGMDQATLERIYEPFFTTKGPGEGTGLGLSVVHGIMKSHDGGITVQSCLGEGSTFQLYFPIHGVEASAPPAESDPVPRSNGQHVLFVDDEEPLSMIGGVVLRHLGYQVTTKKNGAEALAAVREHPDRFDIVITDLTMPGLSGTDLARELLAIRPELPIILTTGFSANITAEVARQIGFRDLLFKPNNIRTLGEAIHRVLRGSNPP